MPVTWNMVPNGRDAIMGMDVPREDSVVQTVVSVEVSAMLRSVVMGYDIPWLGMSPA